MLKKIKSNYIVLLGFVVAIALVLRLWMLGVVPPSPDWDEAALGYNAYSILTTGKDEYGKLFPLVLRSFDDYKPGLYTYFIIPLLPLFGLTVFTVRLPSVIFGAVTIIATYFLVKQLLKNTDEKSSLNPSIVGLISALMLAISPWHLQFSRIAFESNVGVAFNVLGALAFVKSLNRKWLLVVSVFVFAANIYVYQSNKVFTPLLLLGLVLIFKDALLKFPKKILITSVLVGFLIGLPMIISTITDKASLARAQGVSVFSDSTQFLKNNAQKIARDTHNNDTVGLVLDNRRFEYAKAVVAGYISHFDLNWLFITGDLPRHHAPNMGILYIWELPFVLVGMYMLLFGKFPRRAKLVFFAWYLLAAVPASITSGVPHAIRTLNFLPMYPVFTAIGILTMYYSLVRIRFFFLRYILFLIIAVAGLFNFIYYLNQYFVQQNYYTSAEWQYGYKEVVEEVKKIEKNYEKIIVSNKPHLDQSYIFFLFYLQYPPLEYQEASQNASGGFRENHTFGKYEFRPIEWEKEQKNGKTLFVGRPEDFPPGVREIKIIHFLDEKPAIKIVEG